MTYTIDFERKADEMDEPFEPTDADYAGDPDFDDDCADCGVPLPAFSLSQYCNSCDAERYYEATQMDRFDAKFGI